MQIVLILVKFYSVISIDDYSSYHKGNSQIRSILDNPIQHNTFYMDAGILPPPTKFRKKDSAYWSNPSYEKNKMILDSRDTSVLSKPHFLNQIYISRQAENRKRNDSPKDEYPASKQKHPKSIPISRNTTGPLPKMSSARLGIPTLTGSINELNYSEPLLEPNYMEDMSLFSLNNTKNNSVLFKDKRFPSVNTTTHVTSTKSPSSPALVLPYQYVFTNILDVTESPLVHTNTSYIETKSIGMTKALMNSLSKPSDSDTQIKEILRKSLQNKKIVKSSGSQVNDSYHFPSITTPIRMMTSNLSSSLSYPAISRTSSIYTSGGTINQVISPELPTIRLETNEAPKLLGKTAIIGNKFRCRFINGCDENYYNKEARNILNSDNDTSTSNSSRIGETITHNKTSYDERKPNMPVTNTKIDGKNINPSTSQQNHKTHRNEMDSSINNNDKTYGRDNTMKLLTKFPSNVREKEKLPAHASQVFSINNEQVKPVIDENLTNLKVSKIFSSLSTLIDLVDSNYQGKSTNFMDPNVDVPYPYFPYERNGSKTVNAANIRYQDIPLSNHVAVKNSNSKEWDLLPSVPPHLVPLGPDGFPLFKSTVGAKKMISSSSDSIQNKFINSNQNITSRFPFLAQASTTLRPTPTARTNLVGEGHESLIIRVLNRMTENPEVRDGMMNGMMAVAPIAMLAILSSVDLPALLLAPFAAVLPTFLFGAIGESNLNISPSTGIEGSHALNLTVGGQLDSQNNMEIPRPPSITSDDSLADEMAETLYPHLHSLLGFILG